MGSRTRASDAYLITDEQVTHFGEQGYLMLREAIDAATLDRLRDVFADTVDRQAAQWLDEGLITDACASHGFDSRYTALREQLPPTFSNSWKRIIVSRPVFELWQHPALIGAMRCLLGDEIWAHGTWNGRPRPPHQPVMSIGWHQDAHYYKDYDEADGRVISVWMPLVPVDGQTGTLEVIGGFHKNGVRPQVRFALNGLVGLAEADVAGREVVTCVMEPGDVLLFHDLTAHRSVDNTSDRIRWSIDIRYCSATATKLVEKSGRGYYAFSGADATRVGSYEDWAGQYDYDGEF